MIKESDQYVCILSTGKITDFHLAEDALKNEGIPFYKQQRNDSGLVLAMPLAPVMGPGIFFELLVPNPHQSKARVLLEKLPIEKTTTPEFWHFSSNQKQKSIWRIGVIIILGLALIISIANLVV